MTDQFTKPFTDLLNPAKFGQLPGQMQTAFQDGLAKTRDLTLKSIDAAKTGAESLGKSSVVPKETGALTTKAFEQAIENTEAAFLAALAVAQAKSPIEAMQLQAKYVQAQFTKAGAQSKELFELSTKLTQKTAEAVTGLVTKSAGPFKV